MTEKRAAIAVSTIPRRLLLAGGGALLAAPASRRALAQAWPVRPVRVIVPYAAGGATDIFSRHL